MRTRPAAPPTVPGRSPRVAAGIVVAVLAVAIPLAVAVAILAAAPALAAEALGLVVVTPQTGDVVGRTFTVRVQMLGGDASAEARFYVTLDGLVANGERVTSSRAPLDATVLTVTPSSEAVLSLKDVAVGDHRLSVVPLTSGLRAPPPVTISVRTGTGTGPAGIIIGILLAALFLLYRRRILNPRLRGLEHPGRRDERDKDKDEGEGEDGRVDRDRREGWD